ncbi:hypothetical protein D3C80_1959100 [compost metagenome]
MTGICIAVGEIAEFADHHLRHAIRDQYAANRQVTRGQTLGDGCEIGLDAKMLVTEP